MDMNNHQSLYWEKGELKIVNYSVQSRSGGKSVVKIEMLVSDPHRLGMICANLQEYQADNAPPKARAKPEAGQ